MVITDTDHVTRPCRLAYLDNLVAEQEHTWGGATWAAAQNAMQTAVLDAVHDISGQVKTGTCQDIHQFTLVQTGFSKAFLAENSLKLQRFQSLSQLLHDTLLPAAVRQALDISKPILEKMVHDLFMDHCQGALPADAFTTLEKRILGCITQHIQSQLTRVGEPGTIPPSFVLAEDEVTAAARAAMLDKLTKLQAAVHTINQIAGLPATGSYASFVTAAKSKQATKPMEVLLETGSGPFTASGGYCFKWPATKDSTPASAVHNDNVFHFKDFCSYALSKLMEVIASKKIAADSGSVPEDSGPASTVHDDNVFDFTDFGSDAVSELMQSIASEEDAADSGPEPEDFSPASAVHDDNVLDFNDFGTYAAFELMEETASEEVAADSGYEPDWFAHKSLSQKCQRRSRAESSAKSGAKEWKRGLSYLEY